MADGLSTSIKSKIPCGQAVVDNIDVDNGQLNQENYNWAIRKW